MSLLIFLPSLIFKATIFFRNDQMHLRNQMLSRVKRMLVVYLKANNVKKKKKG